MLIVFVLKYMCCLPKYEAETERSQRSPGSGRVAFTTGTPRHIIDGMLESAVVLLDEAIFLNVNKTNLEHLVSN